MKTARIFEEADGYHVCDDALDFLDARSDASCTKADALAVAYFLGYTHAVGSGVDGDSPVLIQDPGAPPY